MDGFPSRVDGFPSRVDGFPSRVDGFPSSVSCVDGFPSRVDGFPDIWKIFHQDGWISNWGGWISIHQKNLHPDRLIYFSPIIVKIN